jgi:transcriptional regulator with XRE-family HTH domain
MSEETEQYGKPIPRNAGTQLRVWRTHVGLKQGDLEQKAGLSHNSVSRIETGVVSPRLDTLERLAEALGISVEQLQFKSPPMVIRESSSTDMDALMRRVMDLPETKRTRLLEALNTLVDLADTES